MINDYITSFNDIVFMEGAHVFIWTEVTSVYNLLFIVILFAFRGLLLRYAQQLESNDGKKIKIEDKFAWYFSMKIAKITFFIACIQIINISIKLLYVAITLLSEKVV